MIFHAREIYRTHIIHYHHGMLKYYIHQDSSKITENRTKINLITDIQS